jgi:hypothetical protein
MRSTKSIPVERASEAGNAALAQVRKRAALGTPLAGTAN